MQSFQYRVIHRIITCNKYLCDIKVKREPSCVQCGEEDSIIHFFVSCPVVRAFWDKLNEWCDTYLGLKIDFLTEGELILGMTNDTGNPGVSKLTNWLLLTAKYYIHHQRLFYSCEVGLIPFLAEVRKKLGVERLACLREGKPQKFRLWKRFFTILNP